MGTGLWNSAPLNVSSTAGEFWLQNSLDEEYIPFILVELRLRYTNNLQWKRQSIVVLFISKILRQSFSFYKYNCVISIVRDPWSILGTSSFLICLVNTRFGSFMLLYFSYHMSKWKHPGIMTLYPVNAGVSNNSMSKHYSTELAMQTMRFFPSLLGWSDPIQVSSCLSIHCFSVFICYYPFQLLNAAGLTEIILHSFNS